MNRCEYSLFDRMNPTEAHVSTHKDLLFIWLCMQSITLQIWTVVCLSLLDIVFIGIRIRQNTLEDMKQLVYITCHSYRNFVTDISITGKSIVVLH